MKKIESTYSIKQRLSHAHGFRMDAITLLEASYKDGKCTSVSFALNGVGMNSNFDTFCLDEAYNYNGKGLDYDSRGL